MWTQEAELSFLKQRESLCNCVILCVPVLGIVFVLYTDICAVGGCLHVVRDGDEHPVRFYSRILKGAETRSSASEREALAVVCALSHFDLYIYGIEVTVRTDHKTNLALVDGQSRSELNPRLRRFALRLQERTCRMEYIPGARLQNADGFSRLWDTGEKDDLNVGRGSDSVEKTGGVWSNQGDVEQRPTPSEREEERGIRERGAPPSRVVAKSQETHH